MQAACQISMHLNSIKNNSVKPKVTNAVISFYCKRAKQVCFLMHLTKRNRVMTWCSWYHNWQKKIGQILNIKNMQVKYLVFSKQIISSIIKQIIWKENHRVATQCWEILPDYSTGHSQRNTDFRKTNRTNSCEFIRTLSNIYKSANVNSWKQIRDSEVTNIIHENNLWKRIPKKKLDFLRKL